MTATIGETVCYTWVREPYYHTPRRISVIQTRLTIISAPMANIHQRAIGGMREGVPPNTQTRANSITSRPTRATMPSKRGMAASASNVGRRTGGLRHQTTAKAVPYMIPPSIANAKDFLINSRSWRAKSTAAPENAARAITVTASPGSACGGNSESSKWTIPRIAAPYPRATPPRNSLFVSIVIAPYISTLRSLVDLNTIR